MINLAHQAIGTAAAWDLTSFLQNGTSTIKGWGGLLIVLLGTMLFIWSAARMVMKGLGFESMQRESYGKMLVMLFAGGALAGGGIKLVSDIAAGGQKTVEDLGQGAQFLIPFLG